MHDAPNFKMTFHASENDVVVPQVDVYRKDSGAVSFVTLRLFLQDLDGGEFVLFVKNLAQLERMHAELGRRLEQLREAELAAV